MTQFSDDATEFGRCWSSKAGEVDALKRAVVVAERRSAEAFVRGQDQTANALRDAARELSHMAGAASKELDEYIKEDSRRRFEIAKVLRH